MVIKKVMLIKQGDFALEKGVEYLMYVQLISIEHGIVKGNVLKAKLLDECWDRS